jgi:hypothetical protein
MKTHEASEEFSIFDALVRQVISVPKKEIARREEEYKRLAELNPLKRGPKKKIKSSSGPGPAVS